MSAEPGYGMLGQVAGAPTMSHIVDAVQVGLIPLVVQVLPPTVHYLQGFHRRVVEAQRRAAGEREGARVKRGT